MGSKDTVKNPYIAGRPVEAREMFFGRQDVFDFVRLNLIGQYQDNAIVLYGEPRTGKTSVLKQMHHHLDQSHVCVYIDLEGMALNGMGNLLWQVADAIWRVLQAEGIELKQPLAHEFTQEPRHYFAEVFLKQVGQVLKDRRLLLMFDEAMCLRDGVRAGKLERDVFPYLSHLIQNHPVANFIFSIGSRPREIDREFSQAFRAALYKKMEISFLEREAALELITRPVKGLFEYSQAATDAIYRLTSGHPYYIQLICHSLFNRWQKQRQARLDSGDVQAVLDEVVEVSRSQLSEGWKELAAEEKLILAALAKLISQGQDATRLMIDHVLAEQGLWLSPAHVTNALQSLGESHIISPFEPYFFRVDPFRMWVRDNKKIEWVKEEIAAKVSAVEKETVERPEEVRRRYLQHVRHSCEWLDFRGLMVLPELFFLRLLDVYVPLHVTVARSEELFKHLALRARARYFAEELAAPAPEISPAIQREMADEMRRLATTPERQRVDAREMLKERHPLVILGDPGSGKTTFLRYLALTFAEGREAVRKQLGLDAEWLPILIPIDAYAAALRAEPELSLTDYLPRYFASHELDLPELSPYFRQKLAAGHCLVLLDGLDTVLDSAERLQVTHRVESFINRYAENRFVVTSRIEGYREAPLVGDYLHCTASDLEMPEVERFSNQWSLACEIQPGDTPERRAWAGVQASRLTEAIKAAPGVRRLTGNPLLLTMVALVYRQGRLPRHRIALYAECARTLIERWNKVRSRSMQPVGLPMDPTEAFRNFGPLALWMHEEKRRGTVSGEELERKLRELLIDRGLPEEDARTAARTFLEMERNQVGLLVERGVNAYGFSHLTFQEYFAARAITARREKIVDKLREHLHDPRWREVILLAAGQIGVRQAEEEAVTALVQAIADSHSPLEEILHRDLLLTGRCLADDVGVSYRERGELLKQLLGLWQAAPFDRLRREITGILAAMQGTACEPQVVKALLADLDVEDPEMREMAADALGRMGMTSDQVLDALTEALRIDKRPRVRAHAALALSRLNVAPERVARVLDDALKGDLEREVRLHTAEALAYIGQENEQAIDLLLSALEDADGNVRGSAAAALTSLRNPQEHLVNALLRSLRDSRVDVRTNAADILGRLGQHFERVVTCLIEVLRDPSEDARINAAMALGQVGETSDRVVQALIKCLADDSRVVRKNAAAALGRLGAKADNVVAALEKVLQDERTGVGAADALGQAGRADLSIAGATERQLQATDWRDRIRAVEALVNLDKEGQASQKVIETLADVLEEEHRMGWDVLAGTAITLSEVAKRSDAALSGVVGLLQSESWVVRTAAAEALGRAEKATPEVIEALIGRLKRDSKNNPIEPDDHVRGNAVAALGALGKVDDQVVEMVVAALGDYHGYVRVAAADALSKLGVRGKEKLIDGLIGLLDDGYYSHYHDKYVRDAAFDALWALAPYSTVEQVQ